MGTLSSTYGLRIEPSESDPFLSISKKAMMRVIDAAVPGKYLCVRPLLLFLVEGVLTGWCRIAFRG